MPQQRDRPMEKRHYLIIYSNLPKMFCIRDMTSALGLIANAPWTQPSYPVYNS